MIESLEQTVARLLGERGETISVAESCTGGQLAARLTALAGSSVYFQAGVIAYADEAKTRWLKIPEDLIAQHGAVSETVAEQMARQIRRRQGSDWGIGITGIAGPGGGSRRKPVGLVYIAIAGKNECLTVQCRFPGSRAEIQEAAVTAALSLLLEFLDPSLETADE